MITEQILRKAFVLLGKTKPVGVEIWIGDDAEPDDIDNEVVDFLVTVINYQLRGLL